MAKFSFHCQCYKAGQLGGIDKHNRRLNKNYLSNPDIDLERSKENRIYIAPKQSLYKDCKDIINKKVIANGGRVTKASNWICECIFSYPEELPIERLDEYNDLVIKYMGARLGADKYNKLIEDKEALERKNRDKAYEVIKQQERNR